MKLLRPAAVLLASVCPVLAGDLIGHAVITKRLTKRTLSPLTYNLRGAVTSAISASEPINEFDQMVVMLEGGSVPPRAPVTAVLDQRDAHFDPEIVIVPVGSTVEFPNSDPIFHNVFSLSKARPFDLGFYPEGQSRAVKFTHPGIIQVYCHIHANMYGAIIVTSSPWYGKPSSDGGFAWKDIPAGHYRLSAWHKIAGLYKTEVDVPASGAVEVSIQVPVNTERR